MDLENGRPKVVEAPLLETASGLVPEGDGWFVLNVRDARWYDDPSFGRYTRFEGEQGFAEYGVNVHVLAPGKPNCMYHGEGTQESFLVLSGECLLVIEGQERRLRAWDFVHCPPWTEHVLVGAGDGPCAVLMIGGRPPDLAVRYPLSQAAARHGAAVETATESPREAYAGRPEPAPRRYSAGDVPGA